MSISLSACPPFIQENYEIFNYNHALAILSNDFPNEWSEIVKVLVNFRLYRDDILTAGGQKSPIAGKLDGQFYGLGWEEKLFNTKVVVDGNERVTPTHKVDCFKNKVAIEIEWNNKDPFFDRDLNNFRLLFELKAISIGVIITRSTSLQQIFKALGKGSAYGASTTHFNKLKPRIEGNGGGGCPVLALAIKPSLYCE